MAFPDGKRHIPSPCSNGLRVFLCPPSVAEDTDSSSHGPQGLEVGGFQFPPECRVADQAFDIC